MLLGLASGNMGLDFIVSDIIILLPELFFRLLWQGE